MTQSRRIVSAAYLGIAALALVACWRQNVAFISSAGTNLLDGFIQFWPALLANHATTSITIDIFLFGLAAVVWMVFEARSLGIRYVWLYVILAFVIAISVTFPLFLAARERRLDELGRPGNEPVPAGADVAGMAIVGIPIVLFALYTLVS